MSAPLIPNLLSLRGGRGGRGGFRSRRGGPSGFGGDHGDAAVQGTDTDAAVSRMSAVELGYMEDPYAPFFVSRADGPNPRRLPIINRGTYTRTKALDRIIDAFLSDSDSKPRQIISLGAGTDTRPFRVFSSDRPASIVYHELDFDVTSKKKLQTVRGVPLLSKILTDIGSKDSGSWISNPSTGGEYYSHGIDLRSLDPEATCLTGLRTDLPTLLLSECCLCYLRRQDCDRVISYFKSKIPSLAILLYEPMHLDDAFGDTMVANLAARHISMPGFETYRNAKDQIKRLNTAGFDTIRYMTIEDAWEEWVPQQEKQRVHQLEGLDEVEEWKLLAGHYIVIWGHSGHGFDGLSQIKGID